MKKLTRFLLVAAISFSMAFLVSLTAFGGGSGSAREQTPAMNAQAVVMSDSSWEAPLRISNTFEPSQYPSLAIDGDGVTNIVWVESSAALSSIMFCRLGPSSHYIISPVSVYQSHQDIFYPQIALDRQDHIMLAWGESSPLEIRYFFTKLNLEGEMVMNKVEVGEASLIDRSVTGSRETYTNDQGYIDMSIGDGLSKISSKGKMLTTYNELHPRVKVDSTGAAVVVWADPGEGNYDIYLSKIGPNGSLLISQTKLIDSDSQSFAVDLYIDREDSVHIVYNENSPTQTRVMYAKYRSDLITLIPPKAIMSDMRSYRIEPAMIGDAAGDMHIVYADGRDVASGGSYQIRHKMLDPNGIATGEETCLTDGYTSSHHPRLSVDLNDTIHMVWEQSLDAIQSGDALELDGIYHMTLSENGTLKGEKSRVSVSTLPSISPQVECGPDGQPHVIWVDTANGNREVYFRKGAAREMNMGASPEEVAPEDIDGSDTAKITLSTIIMGAAGIAVYYGAAVGGKGAGIALIPLYSRVKGDKVLENDKRANLLAHIRINPGVTFSELMTRFGMKNGVMAYHLRRLEGEEFIKSSKDGIYKRYYVWGTPNVPTYIQIDILEEIRTHPGTSQSQIASSLGTSRQVVNYHMNILERNGKIWVKRNGQRTACYPRNVE